jgi:hypothetical protein
MVPLPGVHIGGNEIGTLMDIITARMEKFLLIIHWITASQGAQI